MRDMTMVTAIAKSIKPSNNMQIHGARTFHRLNIGLLLLNHQKLLKKLAVLIVQRNTFDSKMAI
jgi:hypothetical protein